MDKIPDDILQMIFEVYVLEIYRSPVSILIVSRRWHGLLLSMSNLWSQVNIRIDSLETIPSLIGGMIDKVSPLNTNFGLEAPLLTYLKRSIPRSSSLGLPLNISIQSDFNPSHDVEDIQLLDAQIGVLLRCLAAKLSTCEVEDEILNVMKIDRSLPPQWKSFSISLESYEQLTGYIPRVDLATLGYQGPTILPLLTTLVLNKVDVRFGATQMPNLKHLDIFWGDIDRVPDLRSVEWLSMRHTLCNNYTVRFDWKELENLCHLYIHDNGGFNVPDNHSFPNLTVIQLDSNTPNVLVKLSTIFRNSRCLHKLALKERRMKAITEGFQLATDFRVKEVTISSRNLLGRPHKMTWAWLEYGNHTWDITEQVIGEVCDLLRELSIRRGIKVGAMDAQMDAILDLCRRRMQTTL